MYIKQRNQSSLFAEKEDKISHVLAPTFSIYSAVVQHRRLQASKQGKLDPPMLVIPSTP
jgi:hypothetical protein